MKEDWSLYNHVLKCTTCGQKYGIDASPKGDNKICHNCLVKMGRYDSNKKKKEIKEKFIITLE